MSGRRGGTYDGGVRAMLSGIGVGGGAPEKTLAGKKGKVTTASIGERKKGSAQSEESSSSEKELV